MDIEYKVPLPNHNFSIGKKLILSVHASCNFHKDSEKIGYNGPIETHWNSNCKA